jgi:hypothetical protein
LTFNTGIEPEIGKKKRSSRRGQIAPFATRFVHFVRLCYPRPELVAGGLEANAATFATLAIQ